MELYIKDEFHVPWMSVIVPEIDSRSRRTKVNEDYRAVHFSSESCECCLNCVEEICKGGCAKIRNVEKLHSKNNRRKKVVK